jgi:hypothetical protein
LTQYWASRRAAPAGHLAISVRPERYPSDLTDSEWELVEIQHKVSGRTLTVAHPENNIGGGARPWYSNELRHSSGMELQRIDRTINLCESRDESWLWILREKKKFIWGGPDLPPEAHVK